MSQKYLIKDSTNNLAWSLSLYGQFVGLKKLKKDVGFVTNHPWLVQFNEPIDNPDIIIDPSEYSLEEIDKLYATQLYDKTLKIHSIKLSDEFLDQITPYSKLGQALVQVHFEDEIQPKYLFPIEQILRPKLQYNGCYASEDGKLCIEQVLNGMGIEPNLVCFDDIDPLEVLTSPSIKVFQFDQPDHEYVVFLSSIYRGFDNLKNFPAMLIPVSNTEVDPRKVTNFAAQIYYDPWQKEKFERLYSIGLGWKTRNECNHSFVKYLKDRHKTK